MPYSNIIFVKLFIKIIDEDDRFLYQLNESQQLLYLKMLILAGKTGNNIPKTYSFIKNTINYGHEQNCFEADIKRIMVIFPKLKEGKDHYYFDKFNELHNFIDKKYIKEQKNKAKRSKNKRQETLGKHLGNTKYSTREEVEVDKEVDKDITTTPILHKTSIQKAELACEKTPQADFIKRFGDYYTKKTGHIYKADAKHYVLVSNMLKKYGFDLMAEKAVILAELCENCSAWFTKDGWADFTVEKISQQWNAIISKKGKSIDKWEKYFNGREDVKNEVQ